LLQLTVLVGIARRAGSARRLGVGLCIAGGTVGVVVCLLAPLGWYFGWIIMEVGLALALPNAIALALLTSESAREWCDE
jgi:hypothetical protein